MIQSTRCRLTLIAAMDENRLIGLEGGGLPWAGLERDKQHFRDYTEGKAMLLGRQTFEEMSGWFGGGRRPIVVSRDRGYVAEGGYPVVDSVVEGIELAEASGEAELVVSGGAAIYALAMPLADELNITIVHERFAAEGGAYFPGWQGLGFREVARQRFEADADKVHAMSFVRLSKGGR